MLAPPDPNIRDQKTIVALQFIAGLTLVFGCWVIPAFLGAASSWMMAVVGLGVVSLSGLSYKKLQGQQVDHLLNPFQRLDMHEKLILVLYRRLYENGIFVSRDRIYCTKPGDMVGALTNANIFIKSCQPQELVVTIDGYRCHFRNRTSLNNLEVTIINPEGETVIKKTNYGHQEFRDWLAHVHEFSLKKLEDELLGKMYTDLQQHIDRDEVLSSDESYALHRMGVEQELDRWLEVDTVG